MGSRKKFSGIIEHDRKPREPDYTWLIIALTIVGLFAVPALLGALAGLLRGL